MTINNPKIKTVYLAGGTSDWRKKFIETFKRWNFIDPFENEETQYYIADFTHNDLKHIRDSDLIIIHIDYHRYTGCCLEAGFAKALMKPIILIWKLPGRIDSMLLGVSSYVFNTVNATIEFIEKRWYKNE